MKLQRNLLLAFFERKRSSQLEGILRLAQHDAAPEILRDLTEQPLLRVPLLIKSRDEVAAKLKKYGFPTPYIYDPPLGVYGGEEFSDSPFEGDSAAWWASHVLPINPMGTQLFYSMLDAKSIVLISAMD